MKEKLFGAMIPDRVVDRLERAADPKPRAGRSASSFCSNSRRPGRGRCARDGAGFPFAIGPVIEASASRERSARAQNTRRTMTFVLCSTSALAVPDATVGRKFYTDFGMEARESGKRVVMRSRAAIRTSGPGRGKKEAHAPCVFGTRATSLEA